MSQMQGGPFRVPLGYQSGLDASATVRFFNAVYAWMAVGLALTALVAWATADSPALRSLAQSPLLFIAIIAELGLVWVIAGATNRINASTATALFTLYAALNGFTLSGVVMRYSGATLGATFIVTAGTFGITSVYGYVTKHDLTKLGSLFFMALIGFILASIVNFFVASTLLGWVITYVGVLIFVGLTAYDTQKLKFIAEQTAGNEAFAARMAIIGSLELYLDFVNLFLLFLRMMNNNRRN